MRKDKRVVLSLIVLTLTVSPWTSGVAHAGALRPAPSIEVGGPDGQPVRFADLKGKVVLVDFWASWCGPCKASFPALDALYRELRLRGFEVLAVNVDERRRDADQFLTQHAYEMRVVFDPRGRAPEAFGVQAMPSSYLIDRRGNIRFAHTGYTARVLDAYRREIEELLREKSDPEPTAGSRAMQP
jgi:cytochrome c biogenesis protein CcmG, thiol:disulfide interchange protein DsbE